MTKRRESKLGRVAGRGLAASAVLLLLLFAPAAVRAEDAPPAASTPTTAAKVEAERARLRSSDADDRKSAAWELGRLGPAAAAAAPDLVEALDDDDDRVRAAAFEAIRSLGVPSAATVAEIQVRATRADPRYAALALWASVASGQRSGADLRAVLLDPATREAARSALVLRGVAARDVWIALAKDGAWRLRELGFDGLATLGADAGPALDLVLAGLDDGAPLARGAAYTALGALVPTQDRAAARAQTLLADPALEFLPQYQLFVGFTHRLPAADAEATLRPLLRIDPEHLLFTEYAARALYVTGVRDAAVLDALAATATPRPPWIRGHRNLRPARTIDPRGTDLNVVAALREAGAAGVAAVLRSTPLADHQRVAVLAAIGTDASWAALESMLGSVESRDAAAWALVIGKGPASPLAAVERAFTTYAPTAGGEVEAAWESLGADREELTTWLAATRSARLPELWLARWDLDVPAEAPQGPVRVIRSRSLAEEDLTSLAVAMGEGARPILEGLVDRLCSPRSEATYEEARAELIGMTRALSSTILPLLEARRAATQDEQLRQRIDEVLGPMRAALPK